MKISASFLSAENKKESIIKLNDTDISYIHFDIMDGKFVSNYTFNKEEIHEYASITNKEIDAHFMVEDPLMYLDMVKDLKLTYFTFHIEVKKNIDDIINNIKKYGFKVGIAINPTTSIDTLIPYLDKIDLILVMSVFPGRGGQTFIDNTFDRLKVLRNLIKDKNIILEVDGGINNKNISLIDSDICVVGSFITNANDYQKQIDLLKISI